MIRVHVLDSSNRHWAAVPQPFYPLFMNHRLFEEAGVRFGYFRKVDASFLDCHVVLISSRHYFNDNDSGAKTSGIIEELSRMRLNGLRIIWFDDRDSTGNTQFEILPYVDLYLKKQYLKNKEMYRQKLYGGRVYTDYYHREFGVDDEESLTFHTLPQDQEHKLQLSWNLSLLDIRPKGGTLITKPLVRLRNRLEDEVLSRSGRPPVMDTRSPLEEKDIDLVALFNTRYKRNTVAFQRLRALGFLASLKSETVIAGTKVSAHEYFDFLGRSKIVLSLFGWGEICWREMEGFANGAAVIMPDMEHLETWPNLYIKDETYVSVKWDLSDLLETFSCLREDRKTRTRVAERGQAALAWAWSTEGREALCNKVLKWIKPA